MPPVQVVGAADGLLVRGGATRGPLRLVQRVIMTMIYVMMMMTMTMIMTTTMTTMMMMGRCWRC
jgi:hypothetical protein